MLRLTVLQALIVGSIAQELCLDDGVPESQREYIQDDAGNNIPIGLFEMAWESNSLLIHMAALMIREGLGFHAQVNPTVGGNGGSQVFALAGCTDFNDKANMECGTQETTIHVSVDSWIGSYASTQNQFAKEYPRLAAEDLGSMGYAGEESMYVSRAILQAAYSESGLALDFYKSYNTTHHDPKKYFGSIHDVDLSELALCNETDLSDRNQMSDYAKYSGDYDGVVNQSDGTFVAKCTNDRWWYAPACRHNASTCIPVFTAGTGWKAQPMMQWSTAYGIPAALAVSGAWSLFLQHVRTFRALHYWWVPDSTFIEMLPEQLLFARHSANEWLAGDKKTGGQGSYVSKMVSQNLQSKAPKVKNFVRMINFELPELQDLLLEWRQTGSKSDVACRWLKENQDRWKAWIPDDTNCLEGFGVVDENQAFLNSREGAVSCGLCTPGRSSQEVEDDKGKTYRCAECEPGESQAQSFSTSCEKCPKGTMSHAWGSIMCEPCGQGFYQDSVGHSMCKACPAGRTTKLLGATGLKGCVCQAGSIEEEGQCVPCGTGIACPLGSTLEDLKSNNDSDPNLPRVEPGFVSHWSSPLQTFRCRGSACPGGAPGSCFGGRQGIVCGECPAEMQLVKDQCETCTGHVSAIGSVLLVLFILGCIVGYYVAPSRYEPRASAIFCCVGSVGIAVALLQNIGVLGTVSIQWPASTTPMFSAGSVVLLDLDSVGINCVAPGSVSNYTMTLVAIVVVLSILPILAVLSNVIPWVRRRELAWKTEKVLSMSANFMQVAFTTLVSLGFIPFMCYEHPSGDLSVLKFPNILCGSGEHQSMQVLGALVIVVVSLFCAYCMWGVVKAPAYSGRNELAKLNFLINRFRPEAWWFGLVLLARGTAVSLPAVIAANTPSLLVMLMLSVQHLYFGLLLCFLPWKASWTCEQGSNPQLGGFDCEWTVGDLVGVLPPGC
ncbi:unnamed protein product [Durusdinium trenchii]|uniref:Tyrosine-protein kinase ephrin type A/B receptor-like domain-containing protein n=1 Tax=Durusdinium trenchii TaxID=1381693 RepID=A0ABP0NGA6_9DINO